MAKRTPKPSYEQQLRNVASVLMQYTEVTRPANGRGRPPTYAARVDAIAQTGRQLAEMVLAYLDAGGVDHLDAPTGTPDDDDRLPF